MSQPNRTSGDHEIFTGRIHGKAAFAQNDTGRDPVFDWVIKATIGNCQVTREQFYGMHKATARAANCHYIEHWEPN